MYKDGILSRDLQKTFAQKSVKAYFVSCVHRDQVLYFPRSFLQLPEVFESSLLQLPETSARLTS